MRSSHCVLDCPANFDILRGFSPRAVTGLKSERHQYVVAIASGLIFYFGINGCFEDARSVVHAGPPCLIHELDVVDPGWEWAAASVWGGGAASAMSANGE